MTLQEHAKKIWRDCTTPFHNGFEGLADKQKIPLYEQAYDDLNSKVEGLREACARLRRTVYDQAYANSESCARLTLGRIADALGVENAKYSEIADKAVRVIHEQKVAIDALERLRVQCWSLKSDPDSIVDQALAEFTRLREGEAKQPEPPKKAVYEWAPWGHDPCGWTLLRDGVAAGTVEETLPNRRLFYWQAFPERMPKWVESQISPSFPLAKAAVEAVVRAHYGDEA